MRLEAAKPQAKVHRPGEVDDQGAGGEQVGVDGGAGEAEGGEAEGGVEGVGVDFGGGLRGEEEVVGEAAGAEGGVDAV